MARLWVCFLVILLAFSCSKENEPLKTSKITFNFDKSVFATLTTGIAIWGVRTNGEGFMALVFDDEDDVFDLDIQQGKWVFYAIGWDGDLGVTAPFTDADPRCFVSTEEDIGGDQDSVNIDLSTENCPSFGDIFTSNTFIGGGFHPPKIGSCQSLTDIDTASDNCDISAGNLVDKGEFDSYRIELTSFDPITDTPLPGLMSECAQTIDTDPLVDFEDTAQTGLSDPVRIPIGGQLPIPTIIHAYRGPDCEEEEKAAEIFYPLGISGPNVSGRDQIDFLDDGTDERRIFLTSSESGAGFSPMQDILPNWDCGNGTAFAYCGDSTPNGDFKYGFYYSGTDPQTIFLDTSNYTSSCIVNSPVELILDSSCECEDEVCSVDLHADPTSCGGPCNYENASSAGLATEFDEDMTLTPVTVKAMAADSKGIALLMSQGLLHGIYGTEDGVETPLVESFDPEREENHRFFGLIGDARKFLGAQEVGGVFFKAGVDECSKIGTPGFDHFEFELEDEGELEEVVVDASAGETVIPDFIFGDNLSDTNTSGAKFQKRIEISFSSANEEETVVTEFNCPGAPGGDKIGMLAFSGEHSDAEEAVLAFWNTNLASTASPDTSRVEFFISEKKYIDGELKVEEWGAGRLLKTASDTQMRGWHTFVENNMTSEDPYFQMRFGFEFDAAVLEMKMDYLTYGGTSYTADNSLSLSDGGGDTDCYDFDTFAHSAPGCVGFFVSDLDDSAPSQDGPKAPAIDSNGSYSFDWVGKPGSTCSADLTPMECALSQYIDIP